ncbi:MAG: 50S ribosomal protein L25 [Deltaproteobacteria bacterium]|nr:50S ribosomal protein L25 [Deltaproteobacteria bacterium]
MAQTVLTARVRENTGKGAARKLRENNQIPAIFYGPETDTVMLSVDYPELNRILKQSASENIIFDLKIDSGKRAKTKKAMLKELQVDPIEETYLHADFYEISMTQEITVPIPIHLVNTPVGVTEGGVLQHVRRELTISCMPEDLLDALEVDVSGLNIGDSVHIRDMVIPEGIKLEEEDHLTVAVVAAPTVREEELEEAEEELEAETEAEGEGEAGKEEKAVPETESAEKK